MNKDITLTDKTKVTVKWLMGLCSMLVGVVLYIADLKSDILLVKAKADSLEQNQKDVNKDIKKAITALSDRIDKVLFRIDK